MYTVCQYFDELFHCPLNVNFIDVFHPSDIKLAILQLLHSSEVVRVPKCKCESKIVEFLPALQQKIVSARASVGNLDSAAPTSPIEGVSPLRISSLWQLVLPEKKPNWGSHMILNPRGSDQSSQGSTGFRHVKSGIQQFSLEEALMLGQWKSDIFWQVANHH